MNSTIIVHCPEETMEDRNTSIYEKLVTVVVAAILIYFFIKIVFF